MPLTETVRIPSARVPASPTFELRVPSTWSVRPGPGIVASFDVDDHPNWSVVVSTLRVGGDTTLRDVAVRTFARQRARHPGAVIRTQRTGRFDGRLTYLREVEVPGDRATLAQLHALFEVPVDGADRLSDVISIVATCPDADLVSLGPAVVDLVASFHAFSA